MHGSAMHVPCSPCRTVHAWHWIRGARDPSDVKLQITLAAEDDNQFNYGCEDASKLNSANEERFGSEGGSRSGVRPGDSAAHSRLAIPHGC